MTTPFDKHMTKDGDVMLIAQMETSHLFNTVELFLEKAANMVKRVNMMDNLNPDPVMASLYDLEVPSSQEVSRQVKNTIQKTSGYLVELFFRMDEIKNDQHLCHRYTKLHSLLVVLFGREGKLENQFLLPPEI